MQMILFCVRYIVHDAKVRLYFYIASDILKKLKKKSAIQASAQIADSLHLMLSRVIALAKAVS